MSQTTFCTSVQKHRGRKMKACKGIAVGGRKGKIPLKRQSQQSSGLMERESAIAGSILLEAPLSTPGKTTAVTVDAHTIAKHCQS